MAKAKQDELTQRRRLSHGQCPTHGISLGQAGVEEYGDYGADVLECCVRTCGFMAEIPYDHPYSPRHNGATLVDGELISDPPGDPECPWPVYTWWSDDNANRRVNEEKRQLERAEQKALRKAERLEKQARSSRKL